MSAWRRYLPYGCVALLLATMFSLQVGTALQESQTIDEAVHLTAGYSYLVTGDFRLNPEHPPLIKELAALPLLFTKVVFSTTNTYWIHWDQYQLGSVFLYQNTLSPQTILFLGRLPIMLLSLMLGWLIFVVSRKRFGNWGGVLSLGLYSLDPNFIAHGSLVTTDLGFALFGFWAVIRFLDWWQQQTRRNLVWFLVVLWLAAMSKWSIFAIVVALFISLLVLKLKHRHHPNLQLRRWLLHALWIAPVLLVITWAFYNFDIRRSYDDPRIAQLYQQRITYLQQTDLNTVSPVVRFVLNVVGDKHTTVGGWLDRGGLWRIPGYAIFRGAIAVVGHSIGGQEAYFHGQYRDTGWWYYFPMAMLMKTPLPTLIALLVLALLGWSWLWRQRHHHRGLTATFRSVDDWWLVIIVTPLAFLLLSMNSHLNLGWRHVMPVYPFLFVMAGALTRPSLLRRSIWRVSVAIGLLFMMGVTQWQTFPNELGYFNSIAGGSKNGSAWLLDSNLDWGQDVPKLADWMHQHNVTSIPFAYYGWVNLPSFLNSTPLPTSEELRYGAPQPHGYVAISLGRLLDRQGTYDWLRSATPVTTIGSSIVIFNLP